MLITNDECFLLQVGNFNHYKALYILIETYIRERDAQNPYDFYYSLEDEEGTNNEQGARQTREGPYRYDVFENDECLWL